MSERRLLICATPLHVLIGERLIVETPAEWQLLYYTKHDNDKARHYYQRLARLCVRSRYVVLGGGSGGNLVRMRIAALGWGRLDVAYLGSANEWLVHYLLSKLHYRRLETFDDGLGNLIRGGLFDVPKPRGRKRALVSVLIGVRHDLNTIRAQSAQHHTIYRQPNVFERSRYLPLFDAPIEVASPSRWLRVFLGQPVYEADRERCKVLNQAAVDLLQPDLYFPHPREDYIVERVERVEAPEVFEDWLAQRLQAEPALGVEVISFFSSSLLSVAGWPRVQTLAVQHGDINRPADYTLLREAGIRVMPLEATDKAQ
ncbi:glycosyltransferase family 52 [Chitinolyticbacter meiyuanensis]|uniref:glycosyltransferase family 52 n=1 Tax=Chitinolyticbacter meiyuanensis TaxID=682798 RepID=UPI0011E5FBF6|nr:glycosyltransferase family 52 [Chitinolyticbacter meiyuanensis]